MSTPGKLFILEQKNYDLKPLTKILKDLILNFNLNIENKIIVIKPDFNFPFDNKSLSSTNPVFLGALSRALKYLGAYKVKILGNFPLAPARVAFLALNTFPYTMGYAEEIYLDETTYTKYKFTNSSIDLEYNLPKIFLEADYYFNIPKLRTDTLFQLSTSLTNNLGLLTFTEQFPSTNKTKTDIFKNISHLHSIREPDLIIVDGIEAAEGQAPWVPEKKEMNIIMAGNNVQEVDTLCSLATGINISDLKHIKYLTSNLYLNLNIKNKELILNKNFKQPVNLIKAKQNYKQFNIFYSNEQTQCAFCMKMLSSFFDLFKKNKINLYDFAFILGNNFDSQILTKIKNYKEEKIILFGNCSNKINLKFKNANFINGCPPEPFTAQIKFKHLFKKNIFKINFSSLFFGYLGHFQNKLKRKKELPFQSKEILSLLAAISLYA